MFRLDKTVLFVPIAAAALISGVALASIPDSGGVIHACYDKKSGNTRLVDSATGVPKACDKTEAEATWNAAGRTGPQGQQGVQGVPGPAGPSDGYITPAPTPVTINPDLISHPVSNLHVPDGHYLVTGVVSFRNPTATSETVDCFLSDPDHGQVLTGTGGGLNFVSVPAGGSAQSTALGSITLDGFVDHPLEIRCALLPGGGTEVWARGVLQAIKVGELHT